MQSKCISEDVYCDLLFMTTYKKNVKRCLLTSDHGRDQGFECLDALVKLTLISSADHQCLPAVGISHLELNLVMMIK